MQKKDGNRADPIGSYCQFVGFVAVGDRGEGGTVAPPHTWNKLGKTKIFGHSICQFRLKFLVKTFVFCFIFETHLFFQEQLAQ